LAAVACGIVFVGAYFYFQPDVETIYAQYFPSPTVAPSSTPFPTPTPNWTATAQVQNAYTIADNAKDNWQIVLTDTFDTNENNWLVESDDDEYALTAYEIVDGTYRWEATAHQSFIGWVRSGNEPLSDFYLSVDINQVDAPTSADYGVLFREDDDSNFYYFGITNQGEYILYIFFEEWDRLIDWTQTDLINPEETNRLTVIGEGSHFTFFINDQYLTEFTDDQIPEGTAALAIELSDENDHGIFEFDNFELRVP
jgi:hypothetical protein